MTTPAATAELLTGEQVADRLGISRQRVQQLTGRGDFPHPVGRVGRAVVWRDADVDAYASGVRQFVAVNGYPMSISEAREIATRLVRRAAGDTTSSAAEVAALIREHLETGGAITVTGEHAEAVFAVIQKWLEDTDVDIVGKALMNLRYRLFAQLQDDGRIPR